MNAEQQNVFFDEVNAAFENWRADNRHKKDHQRILNLMNSKRSKRLQGGKEKQVTLSHPRMVRAVGSNFNKN